MINQLSKWLAINLIVDRESMNWLVVAALQNTTQVWSWFGGLFGQKKGQIQSSCCCCCCCCTVATWQKGANKTRNVPEWAWADADTGLWSLIIFIRVDTAIRLWVGTLRLTGTGYRPPGCYRACKLPETATMVLYFYSELMQNWAWWMFAANKYFHLVYKMWKKKKLRCRDLSADIHLVACGQHTGK